MIEAVETIIRQLDEARAAMLSLIPQFDQTFEIYPGWTIKHIIAHITGWDEAATDSLEAHQRGDESMIPAYRGVNEYNEESVRTRSELSFELILREYAYERDRLKATLRRYTPEQWESNMLLPWGGHAPPLNLIRVWQNHEAEHAVELKELLARKDIVVPPDKHAHG